MKFTIKSYNAVAMWKWDTHPPNQPDNHKLYHYAPTKTGGDADDQYAYDEDEDSDEEEEDDVCGICRLAFESACPGCKIPGDDCPLSFKALKCLWTSIWGECTHIFHMHCLLKWIGTESSKEQCPMDRRQWESLQMQYPQVAAQRMTSEVTADRAPDRLPTTTDGQPVETVAPGPIPLQSAEQRTDQEHSVDVPARTAGDRSIAVSETREADETMDVDHSR